MYSAPYTDAVQRTSTVAGSECEMVYSECVHNMYTLIISALYNYCTVVVQGTFTVRGGECEMLYA